MPISPSATELALSYHIWYDIKNISNGNIMEYVSVSEARKNLYKLVDEVSTKHEPALIKGKRNNAVLIASEDWEDIQETLYVTQNKRLANSILKAMQEPYDECATKLEW